jgi:hypothetical protein
MLEQKESWNTFIAQVQKKYAEIETALKTAIGTETDENEIQRKLAPVVSAATEFRKWLQGTKTTRTSFEERYAIDTYKEQLETLLSSYYEFPAEAVPSVAPDAPKKDKP